MILVNASMEDMFRISGACMANCMHGLNEFSCILFPMAHEPVSPLVSIRHEKKWTMFLTCLHPHVSENNLLQRILVRNWFTVKFVVHSHRTYSVANIRTVNDAFSRTSLARATISSASFATIIQHSFSPAAKPSSQILPMSVMETTREGPLSSRVDKRELFHNERCSERECIPMQGYRGVWIWEQTCCDARLWLPRRLQPRDFSIYSCDRHILSGPDWIPPCKCCLAAGSRDLVCDGTVRDPCLSVRRFPPFLEFGTFGSFGRLIRESALVSVSVRDTSAILKSSSVFPRVYPAWFSSFRRVLDTVCIWHAFFSSWSIVVSHILSHVQSSRDLNRSH